ncbi:hypothetical protein [Sphingobium sp. MK2]|uniref:hypothetical protein n=1 Tax=Sphingobium sp. MK2 TaxID=3116540 RepID=UPI0032E36601
MTMTIAHLRATFRPKVEGGPVLIRPNTGFMEVTEKEVQDAIDDIERMFIRKALGDEPTTLEMLAVRLLTESYF